MQSSDIHDWNPPLPLEGVPLQPWPSNVFPSPFNEFINELSRSTETPLELSAMLTLAVVATSAQNKYTVQVKSDYSEPVNLWTVVILPPASRKSKVYGETTKPLREWELEQKIRMEPIILSTESKRKTIEGRIKELRSKAAKASEEDFIAFQMQIEQLEMNQNDISVTPRLWTGDVTPEHLGTIMHANHESMAVLSDEGGIFDILSGLYSDGKANIDLFLQSHAGSPVRVDRGSRPPIFMDRPVLTMGLTIQPQAIRSLGSNKTFRGRGLLGRFLYVYPKSNIGNRSFNEQPINPESNIKYKTCINHILNHPTSSSENKTHSLKLSSLAYVKWHEYALAVETMMSEEVGHLNHITDWAGKLPGAIARLAGLIHIMRYALQNPCDYPISQEDISSAVKIGHVLINHALKVFDLYQETDAMVMARDIYNWLKQEIRSCVTVREINRKFRRFKKDNRGAALDILIDHEIIRGYSDFNSEGKPGRKSTFFEVNPLLIKK